MHKVWHPIVAATLLAPWSTSVWARFGSKLDLPTFRDRCAHYRHLDHQTLDRPPALGSVAFYPIGVIEAGQTRFNFQLMRKAMRKAIKANPGTHYDKHLETWVFTHDDGRSLFPIRKAAGGVYYRGRIYLFDGHHKALISTYLRTPRMPIEVREDWSHLEFPDFLRKMGEAPHHFAHWVDYLGHPEEPVDLCRLVNDPNLLLARYLRLKVEVRIDFGQGLVVGVSSGAARPIALKMNHDIPFYEFEIADALRRHGVVFDERRREQDLTSGELRRYLAILREEAALPNSRLREIILLDEPKAAGKLDLPRLVLDRVNRLSCQGALHGDGRSDD